MENRYKLFGVQEFTMSMTRGRDTCLFSPAGILIEGKLNTEKLQKSIQKLINDCDAMRTVFERDETDDTLYMKVLDSYTYRLEIKDLEGQSREEKEEFLKQDFYRATEKIEYLPDGNVKWCASLYRYSDELHGFWFAMSHTLADGLSVQNVMTRILCSYNGIPLPPASSFMDYVKDQYKIETDPECMKLRESLTQSLSDYTPPADYSEMGRIRSHYRPFITLDITNLKKFARSNKMSVFYCTLFMFHAAIAATYRAKDSLIANVVGVRKLKDKLSIGEFLTGYVDRNVFEDTDSMKDMAVRCKDRYLKESKKNYGVYDVIKKGTEFILAYQNFGDAPESIKMGKAQARLYENMEQFIMPLNWSCFSLDAYEEGDSLTLMAGIDDDLFTEDVLNRMKNAFILVNRALSEEDMTFAEYMKAVDESSK